MTFSDNVYLSELLPLVTGTTPGRIYRGTKAIYEFASFIYIKYTYKKKDTNSYTLLLDLDGFSR